MKIGRVVHFFIWHKFMMAEVGEIISKVNIINRVSQKTHFQNTVGATVHWLNHHFTAPLVSGD